MKAKKLLRRGVDAVMYVLFLLLMGQCVLRGSAHEWLGIAAGALFVLHNALNYRWYTALFKGKYTAARVAQTAVNLLLAAAVLLCAVSSVLISQHIFYVARGSAIELGRRLHLAATAWAFVLMSAHLGLHLPLFAAAGKKIAVSGMARRNIRVVGCVLAAALCLYGAYQFVDRRFWEELLLMIDYQKEYDYSKSLVAYLAGTAALSAPFAAAAHCLKKRLTAKGTGHKTGN